MNTTVKEPLDLRALLATMKSAKRQQICMAVWDRDIKAVTDAIETIDGIRRSADVSNGERSDG